MSETANDKGELSRKNKLKRWTNFIKLCDSIDNIMEITRKMAVMTSSNDTSLPSSVVGDQMSTIVDLLKVIQTIADDKSYENNLGELPIPMELLQRVDNAENPQRLTLHAIQTVFRRNLEDTNRISSLCNLRSALMAVLHTEMPESMFTYRAVQETGPKTKENILKKILNKTIDDDMDLADQLERVNMSKNEETDEETDGSESDLNGNREIQNSPEPSTESFVNIDIDEGELDENSKISTEENNNKNENETEMNENNECQTTNENDEMKDVDEC
ncbi:hypothetical protein SNEBB_004920 [Seison nebaliae]|nr:hypothetical protein SNEBB_004920 [Seison nebaliae]